LPEAVVMADAFTGEDIIRIETRDAYRARFTYPYIVLHRIDLHGILLEACRSCVSIELEASASVIGYENLDDGARVSLADGRCIEAAAVVGADGLRSTLRSEIVGDGDPSLVGYVAHRTIVPMHTVPEHVRRNEVVLWAGPGLHIVHYPLCKGELFNIVAVFKTPTHAERIDHEAYKAELSHTYRNTHQAMRTLLELMDLERRWPIADRPPVRNWGCGHVVLLGDAAHPTLQSLAQGAGMAIEDGYCLAEMVELAGNDFPTAFKRYVSERYVRTARVQLESRLLWDFYHLEDPIAVEVRKEQYASRTQDD
jgi:2-polyprenyl-6-methoxyphenol hydroxylase-like FAD-dependent oxidoreductase